MVHEKQQRSAASIVLRIVSTLILTPIIIMGALVVALYVPPIQDFAVEKICTHVKEKSGYDIKIGAFHLAFPIKATIDGLEVAKSGTAIARSEQIGVSIRIAPLLRGEIELDYLSIDGATADTHDIIDGVKINGSIGHFRVTSRSIAPTEEKALINHLLIADSDIGITLGKREKEEKDSASAPFNWLFTLKKGEASNVNVSVKMPEDTTALAVSIEALRINGANIKPGEAHYSADGIEIDGSSVAYDKGMLPDSAAPLNHIHLHDINLLAEDIGYSPAAIDAQIKNLALAQRGGMRITGASAAMSSDSTRISVERLSIATANGSRIRMDAEIPVALLSGRTDNNIHTEATLFIDKRDLRGILTQKQYGSLHILPDSMLHAHTRLAGKRGSLQIDTLTAEVPNLARIGTSGTLQNINSIENMQGSIVLNGYIADIRRIIEQKQLPDSIGRERLRIAGNASIAQQQCSLALRMRTNSGRAALRAGYNIVGNSYTAQLRTRKLNIEDILPAVPLRQLTMSLAAEGEGFDIFGDSTRYTCSIEIDTICIDSTLLTDIALTARQKEKESHIEATSLDNALQMYLNIKSRFDRNEIINHSHIALRRADLASLHITEAPLTASMSLDIEAYSNMLNRHSAKVTGNGIRLVTAEKTYTPGQLQFTGYTSPDTTYTHLHTGDLTIDGTLSSGYQQLSAALERIKEMYIQGSTSSNTLYYLQDFERQLPTMTLDIDCGQENMFANFMRANKVDFSQLSLRLSVDSTKGINGRGGIYNLKKGDIQLDTLNFSLRQESTLLRYFAGVRTRSLNPEQPKLKFYSALYGTLDNDSLATNFIFRDNNDNVGARIGIKTHLRPEGLNIHFNPQATLFNTPFKFNPDNYLSLGKNLSVRTDIELCDSLGSGLRLLSSKDSTALRDISLELFNIDLQAATRIIPYAPDIAGILDMDLHYYGKENSHAVSSDIYATDIVYEGTAMGNGTIEIAYLPKNKNTHYANVTLLHNDAEILNISGNYNNGKEQAIEGKALLTHFPLSLSSAILKETGVRLDGYIDSELGIKGSLDNAIADGYVRFDSVYADAPAFGTRLHLNDGSVEIEDNKLLFNNFDIYAHGSTPFQVNGTIDLGSLIDPYFDLRARATNYELINAKRAKGTMLYGRMFINLNSTVSGRLNALSLNGRATLLSKTDITYVLPETPLAAESELDGLVTFVNFADTTQVDRAGESELDFGNLRMNITLDIEEGARINADFDENRNSYIELQGGGKLNLTYSSESDINLTGRYTLSNGQLKYSLPIIPLKTFSINDGSYISWTGDAANPTLNITALERVTSSVTLDDGNTQAVAFDVGVELTNTLDNMGLSFILSAPENAAVQNQLNALDKETLNKYAVTMLITGAYIGSEGGLSVSNAISSFLDARINNIAGNAMNSVNISVGITDVENAETGSSYKNYSFSFAKKFWNDRFTIVIGGEVNSGDTHNRNESFINNVSLEWKVSESSNRYIRLFYDKNYESILEGEIIETGVGYVYKRKLDNLRELFLFRRKDNREELLIRQLNKESKNNGKTR